MQEVNSKATKKYGFEKDTWVQTEKATHEAWASLIATDPKAAQLIHILVALADKNNAVMVSRSILAERAGMGLSTVKRALEVLTRNNWIQALTVGSKTDVKVYVINSRVSWSTARSKLPQAEFTATIILSETSKEVTQDATPLMNTRIF